jgi:hypothetical protein
MIPLCKALTLEGKWVEGYAVNTPMNNCVIIVEKTVLFEDYEHPSLRINNGDWYQVHPSTVCLRHEDGKHEHDIVRTGNGLKWTLMYGKYLRHDTGGIVDAFGWYLQRVATGGPIQIEYTPNNGEVIGSIHKEGER